MTRLRWHARPVPAVLLVVLGACSRAATAPERAAAGAGLCAGPEASAGRSADRTADGTDGARARPRDPRAGARDLGDPYFPGSGNGGYDVEHYDLVLDVAMPAGHLEAVATITATAVHDLSSFALDLRGLDVRDVQVDGRSAAFERDGDELVVRPDRALAEGERFATRVAYSGVPRLVEDPSVEAFGVPGVGWWHEGGAVYVVSECIGARSWFPCNDHPRDKATFAITVTVPAPWSAAANGLLVEVRELGERRSYAWRARDPMATYLATVAIARFEERHSEGPRGMPLRLYVPPGTSAEALEPFGATVRMLELFERAFGPYPFESYGAVLAEFSLGGALETQTLPVYSPGTRASTVAHELAHQWFGNSVSVARWSDLWLAEGFASYAEWLWEEHERGPEALARRVRRTYARLRRAEVGPPVDPGVQALFSARVYSRGAWVLHSLRAEVGDETFFAILRGWAALLGGASGTTEDFVAHSERVAGRDLDAFFDGVLRAPVIPRVEALEAAGEGGRGRDGGDGG